MSGHVDASSRFPGGISVTSPGYQHVDLLALQSGCSSRQCRHPLRDYNARVRTVALVDIGLADDQDSHRRLPQDGL